MTDKFRFGGIQQWDYYFIILAFIALVVFYNITDNAANDPDMMIWFFVIIIIISLTIGFLREHTIREITELVAPILFLDGWMVTSDESGEQILLGVKKVKNMQDLTLEEIRKMEEFIQLQRISFGEITKLDKDFFENHKTNIYFGKASINQPQPQLMKKERKRLKVVNETIEK